MTNCKTDNLGQGHEPCCCGEGGHQALTPWTSDHFSGSIVKLCIPSFLNFDNEAGSDVFWDQINTLLWRFQKNAPLLTLHIRCFEFQGLTLRVWFLTNSPLGHGGWSLSDFWQLDPEDMGADFCLILSDFWQLVLEDMRAVIRRWDPILWRRPHCLPPANWSCCWSYQGVWNLVKPFQILKMLSDFCRL